MKTFISDCKNIKTFDELLLYYEKLVNMIDQFQPPSRDYVSAIEKKNMIARRILQLELDYHLDGITNSESLNK